MLMLVPVGPLDWLNMYVVAFCTLLLLLIKALHTFSMPSVSASMQTLVDTRRMIIKVFRVYTHQNPAIHFGPVNEVDLDGIFLPYYTSPPFKFSGQTHKGATIAI